MKIFYKRLLSQFFYCLPINTERLAQCSNYETSSPDINLYKINNGKKIILHFI